MFYYILRPIAKFTFLIFFKKIHISNKELLPNDAPVIIAANHPTAFLEPCVLACFLNRPLFFLAKGVLFKKKWATTLLHSLHVLPVYRLQDRGYKYLKKNYSTFDTCYDALNQNKTIMILAEGTTIQGKFLNPIQKGTARIAFGTFEKYPELKEVYVVPTSVNYDHPELARSSVYIAFNEPILVRNYIAVYRENPNKGLRLLTNAIRMGILGNMVQINDRKDEILLEQLLQLQRSTYFSPSTPHLYGDISPLKTEQAVSHYINQLDTHTKEEIKQTTNQLEKELSQHQLTLDSFPNTAHPVLPIAMLSPVQILGTMGRLINYPPLWLAWKIVDDKVTYIEFRSSVFVALIAVLYPLYLFLLTTIVLAIQLPLWTVIFVPLLGYLGMLQKEQSQLQEQYQLFDSLNDDTKEKLIKIKNNLLNNVTLR